MNTSIYMIGIGGIGMSALAQLYAFLGAHVEGSDRAPSPITDLLVGKGVSVFIGHEADRVRVTTSLVVYSDAVPVDNPERVRARELGIRELSYFEALGEATRAGTSIVVAGTHGKTTTTAMIAKVLVDAGKKPTVIAGSILTEHGSNFVAGSPDLFVIEGCEYRRHFLHLSPDILVITNIELDHTDYYRDLAAVKDAFRELIARVPEQGAVVADTASGTARDVLEGVQRITPYQDLTVPTLRVPGDFNCMNARAAKAAAYALDPELSEAALDHSLATFPGTWRRFEYKGVTPSGALVYDDYAHHPTAVAATITMARTTFPDHRIIVAFHPHLFSRTRDFMEEFAAALARADEVLLAPIYAAREAPIPGVTSDALAGRITAQGTPARAFPTLDALTVHLSSPTPSATLLITMGAGDIYTVGERLVASAC